MPISDEQLDNWFTYHAPSAEKIDDYAVLRSAAHAFAQQIVMLTPPCADQTAAIRKVREAVMTANAAIACGGTQLPEIRGDAQDSDEDADRFVELVASLPANDGLLDRVGADLCPVDIRRERCASAGCGAGIATSSLVGGVLGGAGGSESQDQYESERAHHLYRMPFFLDDFFFPPVYL